MKRKLLSSLAISALSLGLLVSAPTASFAAESKSTSEPTMSIKSSASLFATITGASKTEWSFSDIELTYRPNTLLSLGVMEFTLPSGFTANTKDTLNGNALRETQILNNGKTVRIPLALDLLGAGEFKLKLNNKTLPAAGTYTFRAENKSLSIGNKFYAEASIDVAKRSTPPTQPCGCK
ncbi:biofilm surface layer hydrophobin BslA [Bacillus sp. C28GYM-DRY-1]|uniref:biofilm surface layer hydrophobin BslA n=1 Tax=Bacillus sp. C28GYM-DRY-1 TaxID=3062686 RepID=UPI0026746B1A|nr:biofilm surface layer hydrophobin BslA [Bacillus sp. C28GYM-DRY-1]MDO3662981.1 biofilm surface layer hydrophobin BslA [Bacillus sp. C28GYM-DRY-1]